MVVDSTCALPDKMQEGKSHLHHLPAGYLFRTKVYEQALVVSPATAKPARWPRAVVRYLPTYLEEPVMENDIFDAWEGAFGTWFCVRTEGYGHPLLLWTR